MSDFQNLVDFLLSNGFEVEDVSDEPRSYSYKWRFARVKGKGIQGGFAEQNEEESYLYINGRFAADNAQCFNKWSQCPLIVKIPTTNKEREELLGYLDFLGHPDGLEWSDSFCYFNDPKLPREI